MTGDVDLVFRALRDPTRRQLLDRLRERNGQTLGELCSGVAMTRQSATQHLALLEGANLVSIVWQGRRKLHYLNPVPINEIQERWIGRFEQPRLAALATIKERAEAMTDRPTFVYVTYIESTPERVWQAITDPRALEAWLMPNDFQPVVGHRFTFRTDPAPGFDGIVHCEVLRVEPPRLLSYTWKGGPLDTVVTFTLQPTVEGTRLTFIQTGFEGVRANLVRLILRSGWGRMSRVLLPSVLDQIESGGVESIDMTTTCQKDEKSSLRRGFERLGARISLLLGREPS
jgi:uncharacterized protein YndB with AHSA1/START domain/DNA-binding transcriptional ArsR family regulator